MTELLSLLVGTAIGTALGLALLRWVIIPAIERWWDR